MRILTVAVCLALAPFVFSSCGEASPKEKEAGVKSLTAETAVDVDMTQMPKMMVYSEITFMHSNPERYEGKSIRVAGTLEYDPYLRRRYCMVSDSTACCTVSLEFLLKGDQSHPFFTAIDASRDDDEATRQEDPANGSVIVIQGNFRTFQEREKQSVILADCQYCAQ